MTDEPPAHLIDWQGKDWTPDCGPQGGAPERALHRAGSARCPSIDPDWEDPQGVPIAAFIFGGRRATHRAAGVPGVQLDLRRLPGRDDGLGDDRRRGRQASGEVRRDPFAMLPFCGYHMGDYFNHWLQLRPRSCRTRRASSRVNWFRKDDDGKFLWPGFGENMRVLKWIVERARGTRSRIESPLGWMPRYEDLDWRGLETSRKRSSTR